MNAPPGPEKAGPPPPQLASSPPSGTGDLSTRETRAASATGTVRHVLWRERPPATAVGGDDLDLLRPPVVTVPHPGDRRLPCTPFDLGGDLRIGDHAPGLYPEDAVPVRTTRPPEPTPSVQHTMRHTMAMDAGLF